MVSAFRSGDEVEYWEKLPREIRSVPFRSRHRFEFRWRLRRGRVLRVSPGGRAFVKWTYAVTYWVPEGVVPGAESYRHMWQVVAREMLDWKTTVKCKNLHMLKRVGR